MPAVIFVYPNGREQRVEAPEGASVLETARIGDIPVEGACGGSMACATCHVHVEDVWFERLPAAGAEEEDMLDLASELAATSRLGCQIRLVPALDGLVLHLPRSTLLDG